MNIASAVGSLALRYQTALGTLTPEQSALELNLEQRCSLTQYLRTCAVAAKHGVLGISRNFALEAVDHGIRVNTVSPVRRDSLYWPCDTHNRPFINTQLRKNALIMSAGRSEHANHGSGGFRHRERKSLHRAASVPPLCSPGGGSILRVLPVLGRSLFLYGY